MEHNHEIGVSLFVRKELPKSEDRFRKINREKKGEHLERDGDAGEQRL